MVADDKVLVMNLHSDSVQKVLKPHLPDIGELQIHSANFLSPHQLFVLANGVFHVKGKGLPRLCWLFYGTLTETIWKEK